VPLPFSRASKRHAGRGKNLELQPHFFPLQNIGAKFFSDGAMNKSHKAGASQGKDSPGAGAKQQTTLSSFFAKGPAAKPAAAPPVKAPVTPSATAAKKGGKDAAASQASTQPASSAAKAAGKSSPAKNRLKKDDAMDVCVEEQKKEVSPAKAAGGAEKAKGRKRLLQESDSEAEEQPKRARRGTASKSLREESSADEEEDEVGPPRILGAAQEGFRGRAFSQGFGRGAWRAPRPVPT
jgi:hypothetical protein